MVFEQKERLKLKPSICMMAITACCAGFGQTTSLPGQTQFPFESELITAAHPLHAAKSGDGHSTSPLLSANGQWVVYVSQADNLTPLGTSGSALGSYLDVFLYDVSQGSNQLVSLNRAMTSGGNGHSYAPVISGNGRYVAFVSEASDLVDGDTNGCSDVFVRDFITGRTTLVSLNLSGEEPGNGPSYAPEISIDGRYVAFLSEAANLVANDTNKCVDVFVRDLVAQVTYGVTTQGSGSSSWPATTGAPTLSPDGRHVVFFSTASGLVKGISTSPSGYNGYQSHVYLGDLESGTLRCLSDKLHILLGTPVTYSGIPVDSFYCSNPTVSTDGKAVAYKVKSKSPASSIFYFEAEAGTNRLVTTNSPCHAPPNADNSGPGLSADGLTVVYLEQANSSSNQNIMVWMATNRQSTLISSNASQTGGVQGWCEAPAISADGNCVAYLCQAADAFPVGSDSTFQLYVHNRSTGQTRLVSASSAGKPTGNLETAVPSLSQDGQSIAFESADGAMVEGDNNHALDVFVCALNTGDLRLVSAAGSTLKSRTGNGPSSLNRDAISADGRYVVFTSTADNLVTNDTNGAPDIFVRDLVAQSNFMVSLATNGSSPGNSWSREPVISHDGRFVAFTSGADNLAPHDSNGLSDVFVRDLQKGYTTLVSFNDTGTASAAWPSTSPSISQDGRWIAYQKKISLWGDRGSVPIFWRIEVFDRILGSSQIASLNASGQLSGNGDSVNPGISNNGRYVVFESRAGDLVIPTPNTSGWGLFIRDLDLQTTTLLAKGDNLTVCLRDNWVAYSITTNAQPPTIGLYDLSAQQLVLTLTNGMNPAVSADGRWIAYASSKDVDPGITSTTTQIFLYDRSLNRERLMSLNNQGPGAMNGNSGGPMISGDAAFIAFPARNTAATPADPNDLRNVLIADTQAEVTFNTADKFNPLGPNFWPASRFSFGPDHGALFVESPAPVASKGDRNNTTDLYLFRLQQADSDLDGLPDNWEYGHFGNLSFKATDDPDGDGLDNLGEFLAGTDPLNHDSTLVLATPAVAEDGSRVLTWTRALNRAYWVQYQDRLGDTVWTDLPAEIFYQGFLAQTIDATAASTNRFYRVVVSP